MAKLIGLVIFAVVMMAMGLYLGPTVVENPTMILTMAFSAFIFLLALTRFDYALMFLIVIIPFSVQMNVTGGEGSAPVDFGVDDFFIASLVFMWVVYLTKHRRSPFVKSPLGVPFMIYFTICMASFIPMILMGKGNFLISLSHLVKWYEYVFVYFIFVSTLETKEQVVKFAKISLGTAALVGMIQIFQIADGFRMGEGQSYFTHHAVVTFKSNGILGAFYVLFLTVFISCFIKYKTAKNRFWIGLIVVILVIGLFYTFARAAYIGMLISLIFLILFNRGSFMTALLMLVCLSPMMSVKMVKDRVLKTVSDDTRLLKKTGHMQDRNNIRTMKKYGGKIKLDLSSMERLRSWRRAEETIKKNILWGTGYWSGRYIGLFGFSTAHNFFITTILETGIFGLLAFLWLSWKLIYHALEFASHTADAFFQALGNGLAAGYIGVLVHSFFGETFEDFKLTGPLWMLCGIVFAAKRIEEELRAKQLRAIQMKQAAA